MPIVRVPAEEVPPYPGRTELELCFRLWGKDLDPSAVTAATGVTPSRSFLVGELPGRAVKLVAGWEWRSGQWWTDSDTDPLFDVMLQTLGPHRQLFREAVDAGADGWLVLVGYVYGEVIGTAEEAERRNFWVGDESEPFQPFFTGDRVGLSLNADVIAFLAAAGLTFETHIDALLDDEVGA